MKPTNLTFDNRRGSVLEALQVNKCEIELLNSVIEDQIASHKTEIAQLKTQIKEFKRAKVRHGWLLSMLIRWLG